MSELGRLVRKANKLKQRIGKDRDALRELIGELEEIESDSAGVEEAVESLSRAADALSEYL